jgi:hypothetical protein
LSIAPFASTRVPLGVEVGQLIFIGAVLGVLACVRRFDFPPVVERHALSAATYAIGLMAAFWFIARVARFVI